MVSVSPAAMSATSIPVLAALLGVLLAVTPSSALSCVPFQANSSWSPCEGMTATKDIHLDQLSGRWFMHERVEPPIVGGSEIPVQKDICMVMTLAKTERGFLAAGTTLGSDTPWRNNATLLIQAPINYPGLWDETIVTAEGTEKTISRSQLMLQNDQALVVAICPPTSAYACNELGTKPTILVWGRNATANSLNLEEINAKVRQAGISYIDKAVKINTGACDGHVPAA